MKKIKFILLMLSFLLITGTIGFTQNKKNEEVVILKDGDKCVDFQYEDQHGKKHSLESFKGSYIFIDFWATWCTACHGEVRDFNTIRDRMKDKKIKFVCISIDKDKEAWLKWVKSNGLNGIQLHIGGDTKLMKSLGIRGIPRFVVIDPKGNIVKVEALRPTQTEALFEFLSDLNGI